MEKVAVSKLIDFRRIKKEKSIQTFLNNLGKPKPEKKGEGGDYWITSTSACAATFWNNDKKHLDDKINELKDKIDITNHEGTKKQFQKNIDLMFSMQEFDFECVLPQTEMKKESLKENIIQIDNIPVQVRPQHIFSYKVGENYHIGGVWFVTKKGGYSNGEIGMFSSAIYQYLTKRFSEKFIVDPDFCIAIDISSGKEIRYTEVLKKEIPDLLNSTIVNFKKLI